MSVVLVINSGSSSLKYSLMDMEREVPLGEGLIERIGQDSGEVSHTVRRVGAEGEPAPTML
ncbi:MAG: acetate kinase, partial [Brachybacterium sp.]|nr:acetate kinase [Brachybacterium sp.]